MPARDRARLRCGVLRPWRSPAAVFIVDLRAAHVTPALEASVGQRAAVYQTLVLVRFLRPRYLCLIDPTSWVCFHAVQEVTMKARDIIITAAVAVVAVSSVVATTGMVRPGAAAVTETDDTSIRPFKFQASNQALADLRRRIAATKWPERETVTDATQGVQLATMQKLAQLLGDGLRLAQGGGEAECHSRSSSPRSTGSTSTSSTSARSSRMRCRSSSRTAGPARSSSS